MLLFIPVSNYSCIDGQHVSIHLMLLFIDNSIGLYQHLICFNTSHVTLYPRSHLRTTDWTSFNTSHVTLYHFSGIFSGIHFNVSIHLMLLFITILFSFFLVVCCFNTSHVTLYQALLIPHYM